MSTRSSYHFLVILVPVMMEIPKVDNVTFLETRENVILGNTWQSQYWSHLQNRLVIFFGPCDGLTIAVCQLSISCAVFEISRRLFSTSLSHPHPHRSCSDLTACSARDMKEKNQ